MTQLAICRKNLFKARAVLVGERFDLRAWGSVDALATIPLTVVVKDGGLAVLFRYGVAVFFDVTPLDELGFLDKLRPYIVNPYEHPEIEEIEVEIHPEARDTVKPGAVMLELCTLERIQLVADILSKSVLLALYEARVSHDFDRVEPLAVEMEQKGRIPGQQRALLKNIGAMLLIEQRMVGRAEVSEKPELLWDHPGLEGLYARLQDEFELLERHQALERKLNLLARTAQSLMELLSSRHSLRVEWYIVILIVFEILLSLYEMFIRR
ncbi:MAG: RMD1 family protein [Pseudomonadota bacterium]